MSFTIADALQHYNSQRNVVHSLWKFLGLVFGSTIAVAWTYHTLTIAIILSVAYMLVAVLDGWLLYHAYRELACIGQAITKRCKTPDTNIPPEFIEMLTFTLATFHLRTFVIGYFLFNVVINRGNRAQWTD